MVEGVLTDRRVAVAAVVIDDMCTHAGAGYPEEVCGVLVGRDAPGVRQVLGHERVANVRADARDHRYLIDGDDLRRIEARVAAESLDVLGFYHSHPDHPAEPSTVDRERAWPWYTYIIVPVAGGRSGEPRAWRLRDDGSAFTEEPILIVR